MRDVKVELRGKIGVGGGGRTSYDSRKNEGEYPCGAPRKQRMTFNCGKAFPFLLKRRVAPLEFVQQVPPLKGHLSFGHRDKLNAPDRPDLGAVKSVVSPRRFAVH